MAARLGAYGLRIEGLDGAARWMQPVEARAPVLAVAAQKSASMQGPSYFDHAGADVHLEALVDARMRMLRGSGRVQYLFRDVPPDADILHPFLAPAAALAHAWESREALHSGAICTPAGPVLVMGDKEGGKSSTMAWLAAEAGVGVIADDLVVLRDGAPLPGPRCIDLREPTASRFASRWGGLLVRSGERVRLDLPPVGACGRFAGTVVLRWAERVRALPVPPSQRLARLAPQRYFGGLAADPVALLELAALPMIELERPDDISSLAHAARLLLAWWS